MIQNTLGAIEKAYSEIGLVSPDVLSDIEHGYLTENETRNGRTVVWYLDEAHEIAVYTDTLEILSAEEISEQLSD